MSTESREPFDVDAFDRWAATVPEGGDNMTPEQRAEFAEIVADFEAGRLRMVRHEDVPAALKEIGRARGRAA